MKKSQIIEYVRMFVGAKVYEKNHELIRYMNENVHGIIIGPNSCDGYFQDNHYPFRLIPHSDKNGIIKYWRLVEITYK